MPAASGPLTSATSATLDSNFLNIICFSSVGVTSLGLRNGRCGDWFRQDEPRKPLAQRRKASVNARRHPLNSRCGCRKPFRWEVAIPQISQFVAWIDQLLSGDADTVAGALVLALAGALIAFVLSVGRKLYELISTRITRYRDRRATCIRFFTFVTIRHRNCQQIFSDANRAATLASVSKRMQFYVTVGKETDDYDVIAAIARHLPYKLQLDIRILTEYDRLLLAMYLKLGTAEFRELSVDRKSRAVNNLFDAAEDVKRAARRVIAGLGEYRYLEKLEPIIARRVEELERHPTQTAPAAAAQPAAAAPSRGP